jgi:hypothetical protein
MAYPPFMVSEDTPVAQQCKEIVDARAPAPLRPLKLVDLRRSDQCRSSVVEFLVGFFTYLSART